jgi:macrolide-specific efflux system membrane fusion protein
MLTWLNRLNTNLNLFSALSKKATAAVAWLKARKLLTVALVIFLTVGGYITYQKVRPKTIAERYELTTVKKESISQTVVASGKVKSATQVDLKFQTSGMLSWIGVKEGDTVKKWQAIAALDKRELQKDLQKYLFDFSKERADYDEDQKITYRDKALTDTISRILQKNEYDLAKAVLDVEIQDIALKLATLTTPIGGIVTKIDVPVAGINITPATAVFTVADPEHLVFEAEIDEVDVGNLAVGQKAELILDAFPDDPLELTVSRIDFNATVDSSGATVYQVEFDLEPSDKLRLGLNGEVTVTVAEVDNTLTVPYSSVDDDEVQVVKDGQVVKVPVATGVVSDDSIEIKSGLNENDQVIVSEKK